MVTGTLAAIAVIVLVTVLIRGEFNLGETGPLIVSRHDNSLGYWFGVFAIAAIVVALAYMFVANHGVDARWPGVKL